MSWLSSGIKAIGKGVSKVVEPIKDVVKAVVPDSIEHLVNTNVRGLGRTVGQAAPLVGLIPGVGTLAAGAIGGLSSLAAGGSLNDNLNAAGKSALGNIAGDAVGGLASKIPGVSSLTNAIGLGGGDAIGGAIPDAAFDTTAGTIVGGLSEAAEGGLGGLINSIGDSGLGQAARALNGGKALTLGNLAGGAVKNAGGFLTGNGGLNALGLAQGVSSILDQKKAADYANKATGVIEDAYNAKAPLRAQSLAGLTNPTAPDVSGVQAAAGGLAPSTVASRPVTSFAAPERQQAADMPNIAAIANSLQGSGVAPRAPGSFTAPTRPTPLRRMTDSGNPYARQG